MKAIRAKGVTIAIAGILFAAALIYGTTLRSAGVDENPASTPDAVRANDASTTPADLRIRAARMKIEVSPAKPDGHNSLAAAYMQKARETADFNFNKEAEAALSKSFEVAPDNYDALKLRAKLSLTFHRFDEALALARRALEVNPRDHDLYGAITDASAELGRYEAAIESAQKMVDLRPDAASYARVSYIRSLHGDTLGAIDAMIVAVKAADPRDPEAAAWYRVQLGEELMRAGRLAEGEREFDRALVVFPDYGAAVMAKARARAAAGDFDGATRIYEREQEKRPDSADVALALGELYAMRGRSEDAAMEYEKFERLERENAPLENDWHHLVYYWADRGVNLDEALERAERERAARSDIYTCDALAWTLYKKGRLAEAKTAMDEALRLGTRDARLYYHAALIFEGVGEKARAGKYLSLAREINSTTRVLMNELRA